MRQRGRDAWELRVYLGTRRRRPGAVSGGRREPPIVPPRSPESRQLEGLLADQAGYAQLRAGTVGELLERWFEGGLACVGSLDGAPDPLSILDCHLAPDLGHLSVAKLTTADIDDLLGPSDAWRWPRRASRWHRAQSIGCTWVLHRALAQAVRWEWVWLNPASTASPPRVPPADVRPPGPPLVAALLDTVRDHHPGLHAYLCLAVSTGARRSQLLALRWVDIDEPRTRLGSSERWWKARAGRCCRRPRRTAPTVEELDQTNLEVLVAHRSRATETAAREAGAEPNLDGFVFSPDGAGSTPWRPNWVTKQFIAARRAANLSHFRLHDLRHFMATQMLTVGVPIATVAHRLSHARASTTLNVYAHAVPGHDRRAAEALAAVVEAARVPPAPGAS